MRSIYLEEKLDSIKKAEAMLDRDGFDEENDRFLMWVCGGINSHGVVVGHAYWSDGGMHDGHHTVEEKACGTTWRWNHSEGFMFNFIPQPRKMTTEEYTIVEDWLIKKGYATDEDYF